LIINKNPEFAAFMKKQLEQSIDGEPVRNKNVMIIFIKFI